MTAVDTVDTALAITSFADPFLALSSIILDDTEGLRLANENRLRQLTRSVEDKDGEERGFGLTEDHPDVRNMRQMVDALQALEDSAIKQLKHRMKKDKLGPYVASVKGLGDKQAARLLGVIGDPYYNASTGKARTVSQLWAYCGLHVDAEGNAMRRKKGQKANWSTTAKSRAYLISESMLRSGNREVYDARKALTEGKVHKTACVRCGPSGKPAQPGSPWNDGHRHADALRVQSKEMLKGLWLEARRLHLKAEEEK